MASLKDAFYDPTCKKEKVIMFVDMAGSTQMKEDKEEAGWITTYAWFFEMIGKSVTGQGGTVVKYLGDGVMAAFPIDNAVGPINAAIQIQEAIADAFPRMIQCHCTIGIACGELYEFDTPQKAIDYVGTVADRAARLCKLAQRQAIIVDGETVAAANMRKCESRYGKGLRPPRSGDQYRGDARSVLLRGFRLPIPLHEILWGDHTFGVKLDQIVTGNNTQEEKFDDTLTYTAAEFTYVIDDDGKRMKRHAYHKGHAHVETGIFKHAIDTLDQSIILPSDPEELKKLNPEVDWRDGEKSNLTLTFGHCTGQAIEYFVVAKPKLQKDQELGYATSFELPNWFPLTQAELARRSLPPEVSQLFGEGQYGDFWAVPRQMPSMDVKILFPRKHIPTKYGLRVFDGRNNEYRKEETERCEPMVTGGAEPRAPYWTLEMHLKNPKPQYKYALTYQPGG